MVVGLGAMGRMHVEVALAQRPAVIVGSDPIRARRGRARELFEARAEARGVRLVCVAPEELPATVEALTGGKGADDLIVAVGAAPVIEASLPLLGRGGVANLFGGLKRGEEGIRVDANRIHYGETVVTGSSGGTPWDIARALDWMAKGEIDAAEHIARIGDLAHAVELIHEVRLRRLDGKAVVYPHRRVDRPFDVRRWSGADEARYLAGGRGAPS